MVAAWQGLGWWRGGAAASWFSSWLCTSLWSCSDNFQQFCAPDSVHREWLDIPVQRRVLSANCAADRRDSSGAVLGPVLDMPVIVQRDAQFVLQGRRHLRCGADADSYGPSIQKNIEILQLQYIDKVIDVGFAGRAVPRCIRGGDSRAPTVAPTAWTVVAMPVVVQRQLLWSRRLKTARSRSCSTSSWSMSLLCRFISASSLGQGR